MDSDTMGCGSSTDVSNASAPTLTKKEEELITESWSKFLEGNAVEDMAHLYFKMFETEPKAKEMFGFAKDSEATLENPQFTKHLTKLVATLQLAVDKVNDVESILPEMNELGARHKAYGVTDTYFKLVGSCMMHALDRKLHMDSATKKAWGRLYSVIECEMRKGMA